MKSLSIAIFATLLAVCACDGSPPAPDWSKRNLVAAPSAPTGTCPLSSIVDADGCVNGADTTRNDMPNNDMPNNDMPNNDMPNNGLTAGSLADNEGLLYAFAHTALGQGALQGSAPTASGGTTTWSALLAREHALPLARYIVSCALDPCRVVDLPSGTTGVDGRTALRGELGLCDLSFQKSGGGDPVRWSTHAPSPGCLQRVSACVLARVNAIGASVPISIRGEGLLPYRRVAVETRFREDHGTPIASFKGCDERCLWTSPKSRNCDWEPRYVGQCTKRVQLEVAPQAFACPPGETCPDQIRVRICAGIFGCDNPDVAVAGEPTPSVITDSGTTVTFPPHYGGRMISEVVVSKTKPVVEFDCFPNGPRVPAADSPTRSGYYSVMVGTLSPQAKVRRGIDLVQKPNTAATNHRYPAHEHDVFTYREGGFYGSLFGSAAPPAPPPPAPRPAPSPIASQSAPPPPPPPCLASRLLSGDQFACYSNVWKLGAALLAARLCAGPTSVGDCFVNPPAPCDDPDPAKVCAVDNPAGAAGSATATPTSVYGTCDGGGRVFGSPITTYLNHPCDLFVSYSECLATLKETNAPWAVDLQ